MDRRKWLKVFGAAAGLSVTAGGEAVAGLAEDDRDLHKTCADACFDCEELCNFAFHHCAMQLQAGKADFAGPMRLCLDCGDVCSTAGKMVARGSALMAHTCRACAECCDQCVAACETLDVPDLATFLASLRKCGASCREMLKAMGGHAH